MPSRWLLAVFLVVVGCDGDDEASNPGTPGGAGGTTASGGASGSGGRGGTAGGGAGGSAGSGGSTGSGGNAGSAGNAGSTGSGGSAGSAGASGTGGGDSGTDAPLGRQRYFVYTASGNGTISIFRMDPASGGLTPSGTADGGNNPSYLAWDPSHRFLFAVNEGTPGRVVAFSINRTSGALTRLNDQSSSGNGPAHVSVDAQGRWVLVANYANQAEGTAAVLPIGQDGRLGAPVDTEMFGNNSQSHMILPGADNRYAYVPCKGRDIVAQFNFDATTGALTANTPATVGFSSGAGPRHLAFHPNNRAAYVVGELDSTLTALSVGANGTLTVLETESTLPSGFTGSNTGADVHVLPDGRFVYSSNRGHNSIAIFSIDAQNRIAPLGHQPTGGNTPRNFHIDPTGTFLLVANQGSGNVVVFRIGNDGRLTNTNNTVNVNSPMFVGVVTQAE